MQGVQSLRFTFQSYVYWEKIYAEQSPFPRAFGAQISPALLVSVL